MPDHAAPGLLRIVLVFGNETATAHVREAMRGHADIVYAAAAADFDAARMAGANAAAALVNLDDGDWLDGIETSLDAAGIAVVYNDPEISRGLEGWEHARWLRHLLAKLRGSADVDPPRPERAGSPADDIPAGGSKAPVAAENDATVVERPLSPQEIETMTVDFVAVQESTSLQVGQAAPQPGTVIVDEPTAEDMPAHPIGVDRVDTQVAPPAPADATPAPVRIEAVADARQDVDASEPVGETGPDSEDDLDVDTETLSAMIDARLADSKSGTPSDSSEVWRVVDDGGTEPPLDVDADADAGPDAVPNASEPAEPKRVDAAARDDSDVLASLPSLDDWQLVDADSAPEPASASASATAATHEHNDTGRTFSDSFAGLELVPMETVSAVEIHTDPIERWLQDSEARPRPTADTVAKTGSSGGKA